MGPSVSAMVEELPQFKPRTFGMKIRYPIWMAKCILKQSVQALSFLHRNGIAHGDFQPGNMLFTLDSLNSIPQDVLSQKEDVQARSISPPIQRVDSKKDKWAPPYLCIAQPLSPYTYYDEGFKIKLSDMGAGKCLGFHCVQTYPTNISQHTSLPTPRQSPSHHSACELPNWF